MRRAPRKSASEQAREWARRLNAGDWHLPLARRVAFATLLEALAADNERLTKALEGTAKRTGRDGSFCWCSDRWLDERLESEGHSLRCAAIRAALRPKEDL